MGAYQAKQSIKFWNEDDRPREKLWLKGRSALSDAELLALIIGSGTRDETAVGLCRRILGAVDNNLNELGKLSAAELCKFKGIGRARGVAIVAAMELGRRRRKQVALKRRQITSSRDAFEVLQPLIGDLAHEEFWVIYLNNSNRILQTVCLSKGGITGTLVDIRLLFKQCMQIGAVSVILSHNHPSGTLRPSESDKALTSKIKKAGNNLDVNLLDHLIITEKTYFSFADENLI